MYKAGLCALERSFDGDFVQCRPSPVDPCKVQEPHKRGTPLASNREAPFHNGRMSRDLKPSYRAEEFRQVATRRVGMTIWNVPQEGFHEGGTPHFREIINPHEGLTENNGT